eukprot:5016086-Amphidinium_carterae.1
MTRQACRRLKKKKQKQRRTGFRGADLGDTSSAPAFSQGGALGSAAAAADAEVVLGHRHPQG